MENKSTNASQRKTPSKKSAANSSVTLVTVKEKNDRNEIASISDEDEYNPPKANPFAMPPDNDIFKLRDQERQKLKEERERQHTLSIKDKTTNLSRINFRGAKMIKPAEVEEEPEEEETKSMVVKEDPQFTIAVTRNRYVEKEALSEYINKKREMFLVQYSLGVKRDEMKKLDEIAAAEEKNLELSEQYLEEDAAMFDEFLKENDKNSVEAIKVAEQETKAKLEKVAEIKRLSAQLVTIKSEISKYEDLLKEYQLYRTFLDSVAPKEWQEEREIKREKREEAKRLEREKSEKQLRADSKTSTALAANGSREKSNISRKSFKHRGSGPSKTSLLSDKESTPSLQMLDHEEESDEEPELYFTDPHELLNIFAELEEQNLSLIQNSQDTEEALDEMRQNIRETKKQMEQETQILKEQIAKLNLSIKQEHEKAKEAETKTKLFSFGHADIEKQDEYLEKLTNKVGSVYNKCLGDSQASLTVLQMMTSIENKLESLLEQIETLPQEKVNAAERAKEKERRIKLREEKMEQQRIHQEERVKKALERAKAGPVRFVGRKLVYRSEPPAHHRQKDDDKDKLTKEEEELAYFFT